LWQASGGTKYRTKALTAFMINFRSLLLKVLTDGVPQPVVQTAQFHLAPVVT
jgi:hypothetical protein